MKKHYFLGIAALVAAIGLSGCDDVSSPKATLATAYKALQKDKLKTFRSTLSGEAAAQYGSADGMAKLKGELAGLELSFGDERYLSTRQLSTRRKLHTYTVEVLVRGKGSERFSRFKTAKVLCVWTDARYYNPRNPAGGDVGDVPESTECTISELR